jgi:glutamate synthase (NADPH/NADH) small chain
MNMEQILKQREGKKKTEWPRIDPGKRPAEERVHDFREVYLELEKAAAMLEAERCIGCKNAACEVACPIHNHIKEWLTLTAQGKIIEAAQVSQSTSNMPEICGRICPQDRLCEGACVLGIKHDSVAIGAIERFINEYAFRENDLPAPVIPPPTGKKVAVVGSGPAGLACADELAKKGHKAVVYEAWPKPGGLLIYGIPGFKLEKEVVERRIQYLEKLGVEFVCNTRIGKDLSIGDLFQMGFNAVFLGTGAQEAKNPKLPGMDLDGMCEALPFLIRNNLDENYLPPGEWIRDDLRGKKVTVLGGGDTAMDCLRTSVRLGAARVVCVYRRDEENMPGSRAEVQRAREEGVEFHFYTAPVKFIGDERGHVQKIECIRMELGEPDVDGRRKPIPVPESNYEIETNFVILAFGFEGSPVPGENPERMKLTKWNTYEVGDDKMTSWMGVFAGGDNVRGADLVVTAVKDGRDAAEAIDAYLKRSNHG